MSRKSLIALLVVTHLGVAFVGFKVAQMLLQKDPEYVAQIKEQDVRKEALFDTAKETGQAPLGSSQTPGVKEAVPPEGWVAKTVTMEIESDGMSRVSFTSDAPLETIVGTTSKASGTLRIDLAKPENDASGEVVVDIRTLRTGVDLRDEHLRGEDFLNAGAYPSATFKLSKVSLGGKALFPGATASGTVQGTLTIRGKSKEVSAPLSLAYFGWNEDLERFAIKDDLMRVRVKFNIKLSDFGIEVPSLVGSKLSEVVEISLDLTALVVPPKSDKDADGK
jgi:polyisoprenoid-binding protein YceI